MQNVYKYPLAVAIAVALGACAGGPTQVVPGDPNTVVSNPNVAPVANPNAPVLDPNAAPISIKGTAPASPVGDLLRDDALSGGPGWAFEGNVAFVPDAQGNNQHAARLVTQDFNAPSQLSQDASVTSVPADGNQYVVLRFNANLPGGDNYLHVMAAVQDANGVRTTCFENFSNVYTLDPNFVQPASGYGEYPLTTAIALPAQGAARVHVQFGANDYDRADTSVHSPTDSQLGSVFALDNISAVVTSDPNGATVVDPGCYIIE